MLRRMLVALGLLLALGAVALYVAIPPAFRSMLYDGAMIRRHAADFPPDQVLEFKQTDARPLRVHVFESEPANAKRVPVVLFHGGGFVAGWPDQFFPLGRRLAVEGYVVFVPEYRVLQTDGTLYRSLFEDAHDAVRFVRRVAPEYGALPERLVLGGSSAGGQVAAALCATDDEAFSRVCPRGLLLISAVLDTTPPDEAEIERRVRVDGAWRVALMRRFLGEPIDLFEGRGEHYSPIHNVHPDMPPTVSLHGTRDGVVPIAQPESFCARMEEAGVACAIHRFDGRHGFSGYRYPAWERVVAEILAALEEWRLR